MKTKSQVVIFTGGSQGIGFGIATCFAKQKATWVIAGVDLKKATAAARKLPRMGAREAMAVPCNVVQREEVDAMAKAVRRNFGRIDALVNNAGICPFVEAMELTPEIWQRTLDVNLTGAFHCTQAVARGMIEIGKGGRIIFITSLSENVTHSTQVDYGASKAGLKMTMVGYCTALGRRITCNAIAPGIILRRWAPATGRNLGRLRRSRRACQWAASGRPSISGTPPFFSPRPARSTFLGSRCALMAVIRRGAFSQPGPL